MCVVLNWLLSGGWERPGINSFFPRSVMCWTLSRMVHSQNHMKEIHQRILILSEWKHASVLTNRKLSILCP